jgi:hypothetical protein
MRRGVELLRWIIEWHQLHASAPGGGAVSPGLASSWLLGAFSQSAAKTTPVSIQASWRSKPMLALLMAAALIAQATDESAVSEDARLLLKTIDAIQSQEPIDDFRCEYEGSAQAMGPAAKSFNVKDGGFTDQFSGTHVQNRAGDIRDESLHRRADHPQHGLTRESLVVRKREERAEAYVRDNDGSIGSVNIEKPEEVSKRGHTSFSRFLLLEHMRSFIVDPHCVSSVADGQLDSRPVKIVTVSLKGLKGIPFFTYHVDLGRGGHIIRRTEYIRGEDAVDGNAYTARTDIKLSAFQVDGKEVWMPVATEMLGYGAMAPGKPPRFYNMKNPTTRISIKILDGTMVFNTHPGRETFTIDYKLGTPVTDQLRRMTTEYGTQKISLNPTKAEAEAMLNEQLSQAEAQKRELVAAPSEGINWLKWLPLVGVIAVGISLFALWRQRR